MPHATISLLTDFGHRDPYVGVMKGVIACRCPGAQVIDLCHEVEPQNVAQAGYLLHTSYGYFPTGTVHVAVVDPGVGGQRCIVCARLAGHTFLAPDNGLLWPLVENAEPEALVHVTNADYFLPEVSRTFHGRDVFAPVAAALASGVAIEELGPAIDCIAPLPAPGPREPAQGEITGVVVDVDRFGNLVTNLEERWLRPRVADLGSATIRVADAAVDGVSETYSNVSAGELLALFGSTGRLEISVCLGNAAERLGVGLGSVVTIVTRR